jgi:ADP-ribosylglycohydrolase
MSPEISNPNNWKDAEKFAQFMRMREPASLCMHLSMEFPDDSEMQTCLMRASVEIAKAQVALKRLDDQVSLKDEVYSEEKHDK